MAVDLEDIRKYLITALSKYKGHPEYEDGFQEAMVRAWKDVEAGNEDFLHVAHRARQWAKAFILESGSNRRTATGAPPRSREARNTVRGTQTREKIQQFIKEYVKLHDEEPTNKEIQLATGLPSHTVAKQRKNLREGRFNKAAFMIVGADGKNRVDYSAYKSTAITDDNRDWIFSYETTTFEDDIVSRIDFVNLLSSLDSVHRNVLYWHYVEDVTFTEVAIRLGLHPTQGRRKVEEAERAAHEILDPSGVDKGTCRNGHKRTQDNTIVKNGRTTCLECKENLRIKQASRRKPSKPRNVQTHCSRGHERRGFKGGRAYCKICNYQNANPDKIIPADSKLWNWDERP